MKKKLLSLMMCAALAAGGVSAFAAEEKDISVTVDKRTVLFEDQKPVIEDSRTLVPLRGVLEAMNAKVEWNAEARTVTVDAYDNRTRLILTIDDDQILKLTFPKVTEVESETVLSDVAPKIINDRTMIPLRVISENLEADVDWDAENYAVTINTKQMKKAVAALTSEGASEEQAIAANAVSMSLAADKTEVKPGDTVKVTISLSNTDVLGDKKINGAWTTVAFDASSFTFEGYKAYNGVEVIEASTDSTVVRGEKEESYAVVVYVIEPGHEYTAVDGTLVELTFIADKETSAAFALSDYVTSLGCDNMVMTIDGNKSDMIDSAYELNIDATPVTVKVSENSASDAAAAEDKAEPDSKEDAAKIEESNDIAADLDENADDTELTEEELTGSEDADADIPADGE